MRKSLLLFICFLPVFLAAQMVGGHYVAPAAKQNGNAKDTTTQKDEDEEAAPSGKRAKKKDNSDGKTAADDWKKNGFIQALFHAGINFAQIDGDAYAGFNKPGFDGGIGALLRFHKYLSASVGADYTMWGARYSLLDKINWYNVNLNYIQIPVALNIHEKNIIMLSVGANINFLTKYYERNEVGSNITDSVRPQPKPYDIDAFAEVHIIIKKQFAIGAKYSYSIVPFRGVEPQYARLTKIHGEYNNVITISAMYILSAWKKK